MIYKKKKLSEPLQKLLILLSEQKINKISHETIPLPLGNGLESFRLRRFAT
jgi:hypothetical protein